MLFWFSVGVIGVMLTLETAVISGFFCDEGAFFGDLPVLELINMELTAVATELFVALLGGLRFLFRVLAFIPLKGLYGDTSLFII